MARTYGLLFSGFAVKLYALGMALYVGNIAATYTSHAFGTIAALPM